MVKNFLTDDEMFEEWRAAELKMFDKEEMRLNAELDRLTDEMHIKLDFLCIAMRTMLDTEMKNRYGVSVCEISWEDPGILALLNCIAVFTAKVKWQGDEFALRFCIRRYQMRDLDLESKQHMLKRISGMACPEFELIHFEHSCIGIHGAPHLCIEIVGKCDLAIARRIVQDLSCHETGLKIVWKIYDMRDGKLWSDAVDSFQSVKKLETDIQYIIDKQMDTMMFEREEIVENLHYAGFSIAGE